MATSTKKKCNTEGCRRKAAKGRTICLRCKSERSKANDPVRYTYNTWKQNAKRRGKEFTITLEQFREFCVKTTYMTGKGRMRESLHIDRVIEKNGYVAGNIRALENHKNVKKFMTYTYGPKGKPENFKVSKEVELNEEDYPF